MIPRLSLLVFLAANCFAVTIGFGTGPYTTFPQGSTYTESGFQFTVTQARTISNVCISGFGNPGNDYSLGCGGGPAVGDFVTVTQVGGGFFTFDGFQGASFDSVLSDTNSLLGFVGNSQTQSLSNVGSNSTVFQSYSPNFSAPIDSLRIQVTAIGRAQFEFDNFVFTPTAGPIPEPSTLLLSFGALAGLGLRLKRN